MADIVLSEKLLADLAGWEAIKQARAIVAENRVLSSCWEPPILRGVVQSGTTSYRAGLVIRRENDAENLCTCRQSREWGTICAHSVAVGVHFLRPPALPPASASPATRPGSAPAAPTRKALAHDVRRLRRAESDGEGEALEIHVILPPNFADGLTRGRATLFFEGQWRRGRGPLNALPMDQPFTMEEADVRLLDALETVAGGDTPGMLQVALPDLPGLLVAMVNHPRLTFGKAQAVAVDAEAWCPPLQATLQENGEIALTLRPLARPPVLIPGEPSWVLQNNRFQRLGLPKECLPVLNGPMRWKRSQVPAFINAVLPALRRTGALETNFAEADFEIVVQQPEIHLHLAGGLAALTGQLHCQYGSRVMAPGASGSPDEFWLPDPKNPRRYLSRDLAAEQAAVARLRRNGFTGPDAKGQYHLNGQNPILTFFAREFSRMEREWKVTLEERLERSTQKNLERIEPQVAITPSGETWFDMQVSFTSQSGERLSTAEVQRLLRGGQSHTRLRNGRIALIDTGAVEELEEILVDVSPQQQGGAYRIHQAQSGFLNTTLQQLGWEAQAPPAWRERVREQSGEVALTCPPLGPLEEVLRPYQKQGVAWLGFLRRNGFGGILADEMGLGKTLQTLAHLQAQRGQGTSPAGAGSGASASRAASGNPGRGTGAGTKPHLVVCPTSLVHNWVAEARKFTPSLRVLALHGPGRQGLFSRIPESDLVVTSYALIRRDLERYRGMEFDTVILDEAQHIKNRQTQNAQAVKAIRSQHRLVLTGTPLENSVLDLWSIFDFLMPGYLGSAADFRERYEVPIVREKSEAAQARLARRVRPFLLRRLKRDVAPELPPRIDQIVWCELTEAQAAVYEQLLQATRREVDQAVQAQGQARSRMIVLTALLRLRQACCDLRLLGVDGQGAGAESDGSGEATEIAVTGGQAKQSANDASGKIEAFSELLEEVLDGGHRVLVFSQFTSMLAILKERLKAADVRFCSLDGSTRDRASVVASFQESADIPVFLISLKAGGVGLNLTGADTVIHFDPWWNPAVEEQATDRAHRIGQTRVVTNYKLITRGTVEEKILNLQERKRAVLKQVLTGEEQLMQSLTWEEISELLS